MDNYSSSSFGGGSMTSSQKDQVLQELRSQIALANAQELMQKMSEKCFKKCIYKPGTQLDNSEQKCLAMCMDRYMDAWNTVSRTYNARLSREHSSGGLQ